MPIIEDLKQKDEERKKSTQYSFDPVPVPSKKVNGTVSFKSSDSSDQATQYSQDPLDYVTSLHFTRNGTTYDLSSDAAKTLANGYLYKAKSDPTWAVQAQTASTDSYTDAVLKKWGIPSAASLDDLIEYSGGGSVSDVYGGVSENQWSKIKEMWSKEWKYDATDVDTQRQSQGLAPSSFDSQYENTLLDAQLKEMGLPPSALISKTYANEYNIWVGNDETWNDIMYDAAELVSKSTEKPQESEGGLLSNATNAAFEDATIAPITFDEAIKQVIASNPEYTEFVGNHLGTYTELPDRDDEKYILKDQYGLDVGFDSAAYNKDLQAAIEKNAKLQGDEFALTAEGFDEYYAGKYAEIKYDDALKTEALAVTADELFTAESLEGMDAPSIAKADEYAATATEVLASQGFDAFIKYIDEDIPASVQANNDAFTGAIEASAFSASPTEAVSVLKDYYIGYGYDEEKATELAQSAYADTNYAYVYGLNASEIEQVRGGADVTTIVTAKLSTEEGKQEYSTIRAECYFGALYGMSQKEIQAQIDSWTETKAGISSTGYIPQDASGWGGYVDNRNQSGSTPAGEAAWRAAATEYTTGTTRDDDGTPHTANEKAQWARNEAQTKIDYYTDMMNAYNALQSSYYYATLKENDDYESESKCETGYSDIEDDSVNPIPTMGALQSTLYVYANNCTRYASDGSAHGGTSGKIDVNEPPINLDDDGYIVLGDVAERGKTCMELAKYLSDDELAMYNYLWNTQGAEKASAYFGKLLPTLDSRAVKRGDKTAEEFAAAHPFWASVFSVPVGMAEGVISFVKSTSTEIDNAISSRDGVSIALRESQLPRSSDVWRSTVSQKLGERGWGAAYQLGMSLVDSAAIVGLTYATGGIAGAVFGAGSTAASTAANVASWVGTSALGAKAFNTTLHDGLERGLSDDAAYKTALAAGIFETLFEKVSLDVFTSGMGGFAAVKQAIAGKTRAESVALIAKYVLTTQMVQSFTEASEELNTELANVLYDFIANGDMNEYEQRAAYLMSDEGGGLSREEAYAQADKEMTDRFVQAGAGGAISGFIMGGGGAIISSMTGTYGTQNRLQAVSETVTNTSAITAKDATTFVRQNGQFVDGEITMESAIDVFNKLYDKGADSATIQSVKQAITTEKTSDDVFNAIESIADKAQARTRNALVNSYRKAGLAKGTSRSQLESEIQSYLNGVDYAVKASDVASIDTAVAAVKNGELERVVEKLNSGKAKKATGLSNAGGVSASTRHIQSLVNDGTLNAESTDVTKRLFAARKQSGATTTLSTAFATDAALLTQYAGQADFNGAVSSNDASSLSNAAKTGAIKSLASENGDATRLLMHEASGDALNGRVPAITALCGEDGDAGAFAAAVIAIASNSQTGDARAAIYKQMTERGYSSSLMSLLTYAVLSKGQSADGNSGIMTLSQVSELTAEIGKQQEAAANAKASLEATQADISTSETEAEAKVKRHEATRDAFEPTAENAEKIANANAEVNNAASALDNLRSENAKRLATTKKESNAAVKSANAKIKKARSKLATHSAQYVSLFSSDIYAMQNGRAINRASIDARTKALESYSMTEQEQADRRVIDEEKRRVQRFAMATGTQIEVVTFDDAFAKSHPFSESMPFDADAYGVIIGDSIYLNEAKIDPHEPNALRIAMVHELTHYLERDAATYEQLCEFARSYIGNGFGSLVSEIQNYYASRGITLDRAHAEREIIAYFASETLLQSPSAISSLAETSRPVANRFMEWLNGVLEKVGRSNADKMITRGVALYKNALNAANQLERERVEAEAAKAVEAAVPVQHALSENAQVDGTATDVNEQEQQKASSVQEQSDVAQQSEQTDGEYYVQTRTGAKPVTGTMRDGFGFRTADGQIEVTLLDTGAAVHHAATVEEAIAYVDEHKAELIASQQTEEAQRKAANFRELRDASLQYRGQAAPATERRQRNTSLRDAIDTPIDAETADIQYSFGTDAGYIRNSLEDNSRIKSADPVVYDDAGNIIPLSERFNSSDPDIRWYNGFDYNGMLEKYGVIENFSRRPVPKKTSETKTTSKSAQKVADSYVLSDKQHEEVFKPLVASEAMSYVPVANNKTLAAATTRANANTLAENIVLLRDMAESGRTNAEDGAFAQLMIQRAAQSGTQEELEAALAYSSIISVEAGRSLQIQSLLKRMSPNGKLRYMESIIGKINAKYATKLKQPYELTTAERNALLNSNSQEESDTIIEQISKRIGETLPLTFGDRIKAWRYFSMLSSAKTHLRNIMGNITMWSMYNVSDALGSVAENAAVSAGAMTQDERTRAVFSRALHKDVVDYSKAAFDERQGSLAQGSKFVDKGFGVEKYKRMFDWKPLDKAAKGVFNLLEKEDQFFMKKRFVSVMSQMIVARGYDVNNITDEQRTTLVQQASEEALKATFRDASKVADVLTEASKIKGVGLLVEGIIPFKKTPINVLKRGVDFSALGLLRGIYDVSIGVKSGKITTAEAISHLTDGLTGTAVMALGWLLSRLGVLSIVGGDGDDEDYDKYRRNLGDYRYMMSIGDVNLDLSGISPIVFPLFMGAAIDEVSENGLPQFESADDLFAVLAQVADPLTEMSMLSGVNTVLEDIAYAGDDGAISTVVRSALSSVAQQFIPAPIGQLERTFDQYSRSYNVSGKGWLGKSASYTAKAIQNKTPFAALSEPSIDLHGEEVKNFSGFGSFLLNLYNQNIAPVAVRVDRKDETDEEIMRVYEATLDTGVVPQKPNRSLGYVTDAYGETVTFTLTDSEYTEYQKELGQAIYAQLRLVMANESYATLDDDKKAQVLSNVISTVTSETKKQWKQMKIEQAAADGTLRTKKTP